MSDGDGNFRSFIRCAGQPEGKLLVDLTGKANGRGAYVCPDPACLKRAMKSKALERGFEIPIPQEIYDGLLNKMEEGDHE